MAWSPGGSGLQTPRTYLRTAQLIRCDDARVGSTRAQTTATPAADLAERPADALKQVIHDWDASVGKAA